MRCIMEMGKRVLPVVLITYAIIAIVAYVAAGFPDLSCGCPVKVTIFLSALVSPILIIAAVLLIRRTGKRPTMKS